MVTKKALAALVLGVAGIVAPVQGGESPPDWWLSTSHGVLTVWTCDPAGKCSGTPHGKAGEVLVGERTAVGALDPKVNALFIFYLDPSRSLHYTLFDRSKGVFRSEGEIKGEGVKPKALAWALYDRAGFADVYWSQDGALQGERVGVGTGRAWPVAGASQGVLSAPSMFDEPKPGPGSATGKGSRVGKSKSASTALLVTAFRARRLPEGVRLTWLSDGVEVLGFRVERRAEGRWVVATPAPVGPLADGRHYSWLDSAAPAASPLRYRLAPIGAVDPGGAEATIEVR